MRNLGITLAVLLILGLSWFAFSLDYGSFGPATPPRAPRDIEPSAWTLQSLRIGDVAITTDSPAEITPKVRAGEMLEMAVEITLPHTDYRWVPRRTDSLAVKRRYATPVHKKLPSVSLRFRLDSHTSKVPGWREDAWAVRTVEHHERGKVTVTAKLKLPKREGSYFFAIDELEYDDFSSEVNPRSERLIYHANLIVQTGHTNL